MLPLCTPRAKYIQLDWSSLKEVCQRLGIWEEPPVGGNLFDSYFDLSLVQVSPNNLGGVIKVIRNVKTDGVGVSVTGERVGLGGQKRGPTLFGARDDQPSAVPEMAVPGCRIVGIPVSGTCFTPPNRMAVHRASRTRAARDAPQRNTGRWRGSRDPRGDKPNGWRAIR
jgi:hypothetical protein